MCQGVCVGVGGGGLLLGRGPGFAMRATSEGPRRMDGVYVDVACSTFPLEDVSIIGGPELLQGSSGGDSEGDDGSQSGGDDGGPGYDDQGTDSTPDTDVESAPGTGRNLSARGVGPSLHHSARARVRVCRRVPSFVSHLAARVVLVCTSTSGSCCSILLCRCFFGCR